MEGVRDPLRAWRARGGAREILNRIGWPAPVGEPMETGDGAALRGADGRTWVLTVEDRELKVRGIGRINPQRLLAEGDIGQVIQGGQKRFAVLEPGLAEIRTGMSRRAQIITPKDAGFIVNALSIGPGSRVIEAGLGSAGMALHLARAIGSGGQLISIENRPEHAKVGQENLERAKAAWDSFPDLHIIAADANNCNAELDKFDNDFDAVVIDLSEPWHTIPNLATRLRTGGRLACYCPVSTQLEQAWAACDESGLTVEWAGELIDRAWTRASKGGIRPGNNPMGHTAFLLFAVNLPALD